MKKRSRKRIFAAAAALALLVSLLPEVGLDTRADEVYEGADDTGVVYETEKDTTPVGPEQDEEPGLIVMDEVVYESAGTHSHPLCGAECAHGDHGDVEWVALTQDTFQGSSSTADFFTYYSYTYEFSQGGNYYLAEDINLGNCYLYILADTNFCLNGYTLTASGSGYSSDTIFLPFSLSGNDDAFSSLVSLNLCDCSESQTGTVDGGTRRGATMSIGEGTAVNLYGGNITGGTYQVFTTNDSYSDDSFPGGYANIYGGSVSGNRIFLTNGSFTNAGGTLTLTNEPPIVGGTLGDDTVICTVTLSSNGSTIGSSYVVSGSKLSEPTDLTKTGYTFAGWYSDSNLTSAYNFDTVVTANNTLYAKWTPNPYTVTFHANNGTGATSTQNFTYDTAQDLTANGFTKTGYSFGGWATSSGSTEVAYTNGQNVSNLTSAENGNIDLYAIWNANSYTVTFNGNGNTGGTVPGNMSFTYGTAQTLPTGEPIKTGYTFTGWKYNDTTYSAGESVNNLTSTDGATVTMVAQWSVKSYTLKYAAGDGATGTEDPNTLSYTQEHTVKSYSDLNFSKTGYHFTNWSGSNGQTYSAGATVSQLADSGTVTLTAQWEANPYTVTFHANDGTNTTKTQSFTYDEAQTLTANAFSKTGYSFGGWATSSGSTEVAYTNGQNVSNLTSTKDGNVDLYAIWNANTYTVTFNGNGNTGGSMENQTFTYDEAAKALTANGFTKTGYSFGGWATSSGSTEVAYTNGQNVSNLTSTKDGNVDLYAIWNANTYTVKFDANGGSGEMADQPFTYDEAAKALTANGFTKTGYSFGGWKNGEDTYTDKQEVRNLSSAVDGTVTLYAQWTANTYMVKYNAGTGTGGTAEHGVDLTYDVLFTLKDPADLGFSNTGYSFNGWKLNENTIYTDLEEQVKNLTATDGAEVVLTALWGEKQYTLKYAAGDGATGTEDPNTLSYTQEHTVKSYSDLNFSKTGYHFTNWSGSNGQTYSAGDNVSQLADSGTFTLTAQWEANPYTVTFHANNGTGATSAQSFTYDEAQTLTANTFEKTGYSFGGWATSSGSKVVAYTDGKEVSNLTSTENGNVDLYAIWNANTYTVTFNANGGEGEMGPQDFTYDVGQKLTANAFTRTGYTFAGWNRAADGSGNTTYTNEGEAKNLAESGTVELFAQWTINRYTITFVSNGGTEIEAITQDYNTAVVAPEAPTREGYTFAGWDKDIPATMPAENVTITAQWTPITYTVAFDANEGTGEMASMPFTYDVAQALPANTFERDGWYFDVWNTKDDGTGIDYAAGDSVSNLTAEDGATVTLYAQWTKGEFSVTFDTGCDDVADPETKKVMLGTAVPEPLVSRTGYTLDGWYNGEDKWDFANDLMGAGAMTLTAKWTVNRYTITFANGYGDNISSTDVDYGAGITAPADPTREGYTFAGWDKDIPATMPAENVTITATWEKEADTPDPKPEEPKPETPKPTPETPSGGGGGGSGYSGPPLTDTDGDGIPNILDPDKDGDGILDYEDPEPLVPNVVDLGANKFTDVEADAWYYEYVDYAVRNGIMQGISETLFAPDSSTSRAQAVMLIWQLEGTPAVDHPLYFADITSGAWYMDALRWANSSGVVTSYDETRFGTDDPVTREQIATILWRYARYRGVDTSGGENTSLSRFSDAKMVSDFALAALQWACGEGIVKGTIDTHGSILLDPQGGATRAQVAAILMRFCENVL